MKWFLLLLCIAVGCYAFRHSIFATQLAENTLRLKVKEQLLCRMPRGANLQSVEVSRDGTRIAFVVEHQHKHSMVVNGVMGKQYERIYMMAVSPDGKHVAYGALGHDESEKCWSMVVNGVENTKYNIVGRPVFSPDGKRLAYTAVRDGKQFVVVDGAEGKSYEEVSDPVFSPDSKRVAYWAKKSGRNQVAVVDGMEGKEYEIDENLSILIEFSPDSQRVAYFATRDLKGIVVLDGQEISHHDEVIWDSLGFTPDGRHLNYSIRENGKEYVITNGTRSKGYQGMRFISMSPDSKRLAMAVSQTRGKYFTVVDEVEGPEYDLIDFPVFSPDSKRIAYPGNRGGTWERGQGFVGGKWQVVVDGNDGDMFDEIQCPVFSPDSKHLAYAARRGTNWVIVVDGVECGSYDRLFQRRFESGSLLVFDSLTELHTVGLRNQEFFRVKVQLIAK